MTSQPIRNLTRSFINRGVFSALVTLLLIVLGWLAGWWLKRPSLISLDQLNYFSNPFRAAYLVYIAIEALVDIFCSPRRFRPKDEVPHIWRHMHATMWETVLVIAVFSDCTGILPISVNNTSRIFGIVFLAIGLTIYAIAGLTRSKYLKGEQTLPFPDKGIFHFVRFPETLSSVLTAFGNGLIFNSWAGAFTAVISAAVLVGHTQAQDRLMLEKFGSTWADYQSRVRKWLPQIW